jgi:hypothetical protein
MKHPLYGVIQVMLNEAQHYSSRERYTLHPDKIANGALYTSLYGHLYAGRQRIQPTVTAEHLGLTLGTRCTQSTTIQGRI